MSDIDDINRFYAEAHRRWQDEYRRKAKQAVQDSDDNLNLRYFVMGIDPAVKFQVDDTLPASIVEVYRDGKLVLVSHVEIIPRDEGSDG